jgi:hypothetical protein
VRAVASAQETFKTMLRDQVAPRLRRLGFKGSGQNFALPSETHWALLGFQRSDFSDRDEIAFTINLTVVGRKEWETGSRQAWPGHPFRRPGANWGLPPILEEKFGGAYWHSRIGRLMPGGRDRWWKVIAEEDTGDLAEALVAEIEEFALRAMHERIALGQVADDRQE